jgi:hypothetical protein
MTNEEKEIMKEQIRVRVEMMSKEELKNSLVIWTTGNGNNNPERKDIEAFLGMIKEFVGEEDAKNHIVVPDAFFKGVTVITPEQMKDATLIWYLGKNTLLPEERDMDAFRNMIDKLNLPVKANIVVSSNVDLAIQEEKKD